jgi:anti-sigma factor RsiW
VNPCAAPAPWETLVAYWAGDMSAADGEALEEHLMGCASCTAASARVAAITETLRAMIPPVVTRAAVERLRAKGARVLESRFAPGERREATFPRDADLLIFHLTGLDLSRASHVELVVRDEATGSILVAVGEAAFDAGAGELLLCCQRHFASLPPDIEVEVRVHAEDRAESSARYGILHRFG